MKQLSLPVYHIYARQISLMDCYDIKLAAMTTFKEIIYCKIHPSGG